MRQSAISHALLMLLLLLAAASISDANFDEIRQLPSNLTAVQCKSHSPFFKIPYGTKEMIGIKGTYLCSRFTARTCCTQENLEQLKYSWFKYNTNKEQISVECFQKFSEIICSECDGDVGAGLRKGLCSQTCSSLYSACWNDYFAQDQRMGNLRFCQKSDLVCSPLKFLTQNSDQFCKEIGFEVNPNTDLEDVIDKLLINATDIQPSCWDGTPSALYLGPAARQIDASGNKEGRPTSGASFMQRFKQALRNMPNSGIILGIIFTAMMLLVIIFIVYFLLK